MYYLGLLHYGLIRSLHSGSWPATGYNTLSVLSNVTFTHGFLPSAINYVVPGGWSIACEMLFYTSFPVVMLWVTTWQRALVLLCVTLILNQAAASLSFQDSFQSWRETEPAFFYYWLPNQAPVFACGVLIYFIYQAVSRRSPVIRGYIAGAAWIIFSVLAFTAILLLLKKIPGMYTHSLMPIFCGLTFGMWLLALSLAPGRIVVNPITTLFGFYSYGGYLCHFAYLWLCMYYLENAPWRGASPLLQWGIMFALVAGATLVTSIALHYAVERPGIQAGRWVIRRFLSPVKVASDSGLTS
jgi:peptidoglycan/LPS O-acetylase OafA/YrhL